MDTAERLIRVERLDDILVLTLLHDLRELEFREIEDEEQEIVELLTADPSLTKVVVDCGTTDTFGSTALGLFIRLRRLMGSRGGRLALCHPSAHETDILAVTGLAGAWPIYSTREAALASLGG
jgi:anti-anti-sigma factor